MIETLASSASTEKPLVFSHLAKLYQVINKEVELLIARTLEGVCE